MFCFFFIKILNFSSTKYKLSQSIFILYNCLTFRLNKLKIKTIMFSRNRSKLQNWGNPHASVFVLLVIIHLYWAPLKWLLFSNMLWSEINAMTRHFYFILLWYPEKKIKVLVTSQHHSCCYFHVIYFFIYSFTLKWTLPQKKRFIKRKQKCVKISVPKNKTVPDFCTCQQVLLH